MVPQHRELTIDDSYAVFHVTLNVFLFELRVIKQHHVCLIYIYYKLITLKGFTEWSEDATSSMMISWNLTSSAPLLLAIASLWPFSPGKASFLTAIHTFWMISSCLLQWFYQLICWLLSIEISDHLCLWFACYEISLCFLVLVHTQAYLLSLQFSALFWGCLAH